MEWTPIQKMDEYKTLYDSAIVTGTVCDPNSNNYGYMAVLNLLTMMCGQYDALPLTEGELT